MKLSFEVITLKLFEVILKFFWSYFEVNFEVNFEVIFQVIFKLFFEQKSLYLIFFQLEKVNTLIMNVFDRECVFESSITWKQEKSVFKNVFSASRIINFSKNNLKITWKITWS